MGRSVSEAAARAVKNSERKIEETRTPEQVIKAIRGNLAARLAVTPSQTAFLLASYDEVSDLVSRQGILVRSGTETIEALGKENDDLRAQVAEAEADALRADIAAGYREA